MKPRSVTFHYTLKNKAGETLDSSVGTEPLQYIEGTSQIIPGLEEQLVGCKTGDKKVVHVAAADAYGDRDERLIMEVPFKELPNGDKVQLGQEFEVELSDQSSHPFRVVEVTKTHATLDGNHPLAGIDLVFDVEVKEAREATKEEVEMAAQEAEEHDHENCGHDHGPGGSGHTH